MRISDWSSDVCSSDLSSSTESSGTATLRIPNSKTSANLTTRNRIANFSPGSTARSKKRPPNSPNPHKEYRNELVSPQMEARHHVPLRERQARHPSEHRPLHLRRALRYSLRCLGLWASCEQAGRASENCSKPRWMTIRSEEHTSELQSTLADWIAAGRVTQDR